MPPHTIAILRHREGEPTMYVRLKTRQHLDITGVQKTYNAGDWVEIGKQLAIHLIATGQAELPNNATIDLGGIECDVFVYGDISQVRTSLKKVGVNIDPVHCTAPMWKSAVPLAMERTLLWTGPSPLRLDIIPVGFSLLDRFEVIAPLWDYNQLARDLCTSDEERHRLAAELLDLRVPVYDTRALFVRNTPTVTHLLETWGSIQDNEATATDERLSFLQALWRVKPLILAVPPTWHTDRNVDVSTQIAA